MTSSKIKMIMIFATGVKRSAAVRAMIITGLVSSDRHFGITHAA